MRLGKFFRQERIAKRGWEFCVRVTPVSMYPSSKLPKLNPFHPVRCEYRYLVPRLASGVFKLFIALHYFLPLDPRTVLGS
jgi:hypothetical protein